MKASAERIEGCQVVLNVEAEPEEMEKSLESAYRRLVNRVEVPGFRKGKAPRPLLERNIGRDALVGEALDKLV
ncbi:MAG: trigger factor family protein, partial [Dehalococcoidia bacterium]